MKKLIIAVLVAVMFAGCVVATAAPQDFIDRMGPVAQEIVPGYGLWPSVFLAQAALESGWGRSWLAVNANNYFGRKCLAEPCIDSAPLQWMLTKQSAPHSIARCTRGQSSFAS